MNKVEYRVTSGSRTKRLVKYESSATVYYKVKNLSNSCWLDPIHSPGKDSEKCKIVEPFIEGKLANRYFSIVFHKKGQPQDLVFRKIVKPFSSRKAKRDRVEIKPGQKTLVGLELSTKKFTPAGRHNLYIGMRYKASGQPLKRAKNSKQLKIVVMVSKREHLSPPETVGQIDSRFANEMYRREAKDTIPVVMAVWKRVDCLERTIRDLSKQNGMKPSLHLWVNNRQIDDKVKTIVAAAKIPSIAYFSKGNTGGFGRYYLAKEISGTFEKVIFIDDDQKLGPTALKTLLDEYKENAIFGAYANIFGSKLDYWLRLPAKAGNLVDYVGTGGMILTTSIFNNKEVFRCPKKYWYIEDLWLSWYVTTKLNWKLYKSETDIKIIKDDRDLYASLIDEKNEFLRYLTKRGFRFTKI